MLMMHDYESDYIKFNNKNYPYKLKPASMIKLYKRHMERQRNGKKKKIVATTTPAFIECTNGIFRSKVELFYSEY